jgi:SAM-dependent methyltransferase
MSGIVTDSSGWRAVDKDSEEVGRYLETLNRLLDAMKRKSIAMLRLRPGGSVLDVGCGLGRDAEAMLDTVGAAGRVVGIDAGNELIAKAIERTQRTTPRPEFQVGNALALQFADDTFDACRTDRVLQHLHDPARAVAEMVRVTRPGGRVSAMDADWHTLTIAGGDVAVAQAVAGQRAFVASSQGDIGRRLVQLLMDVGCDDVDVFAEVLLLRDLGTASFVLHIRSTLETAMTDGVIARDIGEAWWEAVRQLDARGRFFASVNGVICAGTVR